MPQLSLQIKPIHENNKTLVVYEVYSSIPKGDVRILMVYYRTKFTHSLNFNDRL